VSLRIADREIEWYVPILAGITIGYLISVIDPIGLRQLRGELNINSLSEPLYLSAVLYVPPIVWGLFQSPLERRSVAEGFVVSALYPWLISLSFLAQGYRISVALGGSTTNPDPFFPLGHSEVYLRRGIAGYVLALVLGTVARTVYRRVTDRLADQQA
jgi:hypothetical protein